MLHFIPEQPHVLHPWKHHQKYSLHFCLFQSLFNRERDSLLPKSNNFTKLRIITQCMFCLLVCKGPVTHLSRCQNVFLFLNLSSHSTLLCENVSGLETSTQFTKEQGKRIQCYPSLDSYTGIIFPLSDWMHLGASLAKKKCFRRVNTIIKYLAVALLQLYYNMSITTWIFDLTYLFICSL